MPVFSPKRKDDNKDQDAHVDNLEKILDGFDDEKLEDLLWNILIWYFVQLKIISKFLNPIVIKNIQKITMKEKFVETENCSYILMQYQNSSGSMGRRPQIFLLLLTVHIGKFW